MGRLSPDGTRIALDIRDQQNDIWIWDVARGGLTRLTDNAGDDSNPVWTPDGRRVIFSSGRDGTIGLYSQSADGTGTADRLETTSKVALAPGAGMLPRSMTPDGRQLITSSESGLNLLRLGGNARSEPLIQKTTIPNSELFPDGQWLAYQSNESGQMEIHVRPFPNVNGGHWQITNGGGTKPLWARSGRELLYLDADNLLTSVAVNTGSAFSFRHPTKLLNTQYFSALQFRTYDVSPDGQKFLMMKDAPQTADTSASMTVVFGWTKELKRLVPVN